MWIEIIVDIIQYINAVFLGFCIGIWLLKNEKEYNYDEKWNEK